MLAVLLGSMTFAYLRGNKYCTTNVKKIQEEENTKGQEKETTRKTLYSILDEVPTSRSRFFGGFPLSRRTNVETLKSDWGHSSRHFVWFCLLPFQTKAPDSEAVAQRLKDLIEVCNLGKREVKACELSRQTFERREQCYADMKLLHRLKMLSRIRISIY